MVCHNYIIPYELYRAEEFISANIVEKLIIFKHASKFGNAPDYKLFEKIIVRYKDGNKIVRAYSDYEIELIKVV